jgi:ribonuclease BN (tRNA processing enzyme)
MSSARLTILNCGRNGSGFSSAVSIHSPPHDDEASEVILINVGDSTQKFCNEYKIKLRKVSCVFITSLAPHNVCGLPALLLSLSDLGNKTLKIIGQIGILNLLESMRVFTNRRSSNSTIRLELTIPQLSRVSD